MTRITPRGLPDLCYELFELASRLQQSEEPKDSNLLRRKVKSLFATLDKEAKYAEVKSEDVKLAKYAIAAFLDEIVLGTSWGIRDAWAERPLQLEMFNDFTAGEGFYQRLGELRGSRDSGKIDVLEVYATCLGLGFKGKYADPERAENPMLFVGEINREIKKGRRQAGDELSAAWERDDVVQQKVKALPIWIVTVSCAAVLLVTLVLLELRLSSEMTDFRAAVQDNEKAAAVARKAAANRIAAAKEAERKAAAKKAAARNSAAQPRNAAARRTEPGRGARK